MNNKKLDNLGDSFGVMVVFQSMSCDSIKTELLKIKDKAENDTVARNCDENLEVKDN